MEYRIISADDHIDLQWLPADLWQQRVPAKYRDRAPKVVEINGEPTWVAGNEKWGPWSIPKGHNGLDRAGRPFALTRGGVLEPGVLRPTTPELRLADMDRDGIDASVMYGPITPLFVDDPEFRKVCYRAYNDWLAEFCANAPERLIGVGLLPIDDPEEAAEELRYLKQNGIRHAMLLAARAATPLWDRSWEPLWEAGDETGIPIGFHLSGGVRSAVESGPKADDLGNRGVRVAVVPMQMDEPLASVIFSGAFERHPNLKIVLAETGIGWLPYMVERMDDAYRRFVDAKEQWKAHGEKELPRKPSEYFKKHVWATFQIDPVGLRLLDVIGDERVMWASDYPHGDSTWPNSQQAIEEQFRGVPPEVRRKVLCDNAKNLYGLGVMEAIGSRP